MKVKKNSKLEKELQKIYDDRNQWLDEYYQSKDCWIDYEYIDTNYHKIKDKLNNSALDSYISKMQESMLNRRKQLFVEHLMLYSNISKPELEIYLKVKDELDKISKQVENEIKQEFNELTKWESIWK